MKLTCAACGKEAESAHTFEQMRDEFFKLHPGKPFTPETTAIICHECHLIELEIFPEIKSRLQ